MDHPIVGLTLHYCNPALTDRCVRSMLADGVDAVLIWDNTGDGGESAKNVAVCQEQPDRVILEISPTNLGFAAGVNRGVERILARWPDAWILLLNNDAIVIPGATAILCDALANRPNAVLAFPRIDQGREQFGLTYYHRFFGLFLAKPWPGCIVYPSGCAQLIGPERIALPLYDEDFFMYGEDVMLGARLGLQRMAHVPEILVRHVGNAGSGQGSGFYEERMVLAHWLLARKLADSPLQSVLMRLLRIPSLALRAALRSFRYRSWIPLRSLGQLFKRSSIRPMNQEARR